jgi:hypothetical protein
MAKKRAGRFVVGFSGQRQCVYGMTERTNKVTNGGKKTENYVTGRIFTDGRVVISRCFYEGGFITITSHTDMGHARASASKDYVAGDTFKKINYKRAIFRLELVEVEPNKATVNVRIKK